MDFMTDNITFVCIKQGRETLTVYYSLANGIYHVFMLAVYFYLPML